MISLVGRQAFCGWSTSSSMACASGQFDPTPRPSGKNRRDGNGSRRMATMEILRHSDVQPSGSSYQRGLRLKSFNAARFAMTCA
jgi:hypothetical protein